MGRCRNNFKILILLLGLLGLAGFCFSFYKVILYQKAAAELYRSTERLADIALFGNTADKVDFMENIDADDKAPICVDFKALKAECEDIVAWLYCEDTPINYPVVQGKDNVYYLRRLTDGSYNINGSLFLDYRCDTDFYDFNHIIYGHNMKDGAMFGTIKEYKKQSYYDKHPIMYLFTPEADYKIIILAGCTIRADDQIYDLLKDARYTDLILDEMLKKSTFLFDENHRCTDGESPRLITLSTCTYEFENARYVLIGELREMKR